MQSANSLCFVASESSEGLLLPTGQDLHSERVVSSLYLPTPHVLQEVHSVVEVYFPLSPKDWWKIGGRLVKDWWKIGGERKKNILSHPPSKKKVKVQNT